MLEVIYTVYVSLRSFPFSCIYRLKIGLAEARQIATPARSGDGMAIPTPPVTPVSKSPAEVTPKNEKPEPSPTLPAPVESPKTSTESSATGVAEKNVTDAEIKQPKKSPPTPSTPPTRQERCFLL